MVGYATTGGFVSAACYSGLGISAAVVVVVGVRRHRPARTRAWCTLAAGLGCWAAGDLWWYQDDLIRHVTTPFPTGADGLYLLGYVVLAVGVRALARDDETGETVLDAATLTLGVGLLAWVPLVRPLVDGSHPLTTAIALGYPAGDLLLAAMAVRLFLTGLQRRPALAALAVAIGGCLVTDFAYAELVHAGTVDSTTILDLGGWGAVYTEGWDRQVVATGAAAKRTKEIINRQRIYPPLNGDRKALLDAAAPVVQTAPQRFSA